MSTTEDEPAVERLTDELYRYTSAIEAHARRGGDRELLAATITFRERLFDIAYRQSRRDI